MRLEKPHSLSYQEATLTNVPDTLVNAESTVLEAGLWLKSTETSGTVVYSSMPLSGPLSDAAFKIPLTSSTVVVRQINDRYINGGNADRVAIELAVQFGQN